MNFDAEGHLGAVERRVEAPDRDGQRARAVVLVRRIVAPRDALWDAVTTAERIQRWFLPVSGDLRLGGRYQLQGNAGGVVTACERPSRVALTWEFAGSVSWVDLDLSEDGAGGSRLALTHTSHLSEHWHEYGPGAVGVGWETAFTALASSLERPDEPLPEEAALVASPQGKAFIKASSDGWAQAALAIGTDPDAAYAAARRTTAFYTGEPESPA